MATRNLFMHSSPLRRAVRPEWVTLALAVYCVAILNVPFWTHLTRIITNAGLKERAILGVVGVMLVLVLWAIFNAFAHRFIFKPIASLLLLASGVSAYFGSEFGTLFDWTMIQNALQTDVHEASDLMNTRFFWRLTLLIGPALLALALVRVNYRPLMSEVVAKSTHIAGTTAAIFALALTIGGPLLSISREHNELRHRFGPLNILASTVSYARKASADAPTGQLEAVGADAAARPDAKTKPRALVIVVGETARAESFSIFGYGRQTSPRLSALEHLVAFGNASSCGTSTAHSVPCMFSDLGRVNFSSTAAQRRENLLDVLKRTNVDVHWRDNQAGSKGVAARVLHKHVNAPSAKGYGESDTLDMALLEGLEEHISQASQDVVVVLHMMGSHGPAYFKRYDPAKAPFSPTCQTTNFNECTAQQLINTYDNSIHYTDHVLGALADLLKRIDGTGRPTAFLYMSDHGESLGERGIYLHGMPYAIAPRQQTWIPFVAWLSPNFQSAMRVNLACMDKLKAQPTSHDNLFHTSLGLFDISTSAYRRDRDVFAPCRNPA